MSGKKHNMDNNKKHDIETDKVTPIQLIMLVIVLVLFIGAVVLYFLNAAPIIMAFILAAGGAVLVHYFFGRDSTANTLSLVRAEGWWRIGSIIGHHVRSEPLSGETDSLG